MQIVRDKTTHRAVLMYPDTEQLVLDSTGLRAPGLTVIDISDATHELVAAPAPEPPMQWVAGALTVDGVTWAVFDQDSYDMFAPLVAAQLHEQLAKIKAAKNAEINADRLAANQGTFEHAGKLVACDPLSRSDIDGINGFVALTGSLPPGWPGGWKAADNSLLPIADVAAWTAFYGSMVAAGNAHFAHSQALKAQLAAATTAEEVAAISWGG